MQTVNKKTYILLCGRDKFEYIGLILWASIRRAEVLVITPPAPAIGRYLTKAIKRHERVLGDYKGLWYEANIEAMDLTLRFYDEKIKGNNRLLYYYNKILNTNKFGAYIKKKISKQIFALLKDLHLIRLSPLRDKEILINKNPINEFVVKYMEDKYRVRYQKKWILPVCRPLLLPVYYGWLFVQCIRRGIVFNKEKKNYKISKEATWGFYRKTLRDDIIIDGKKFKKGDILILEFKGKDYQRLKAFKEAKKSGFDTAAVPRLRININKNIFKALFFYFLVPLKSYFQLLLNRQLYLFPYLLLFHKGCFPIEILMNLYRIKCNISVKDWGDIEETIIFNKYGTKNVVFHWSDLSAFKHYEHAFIAHNVYFAWGNIHYDCHSTTNFVDEKVNIGCIFEREYNMAVGNKERIIKRLPNHRNGRKIVAFFDSSFSNAIHITEKFFLKYLEIIKQFCNTNKDIDVLLKPKSKMDYELKLSLDNRIQYKKIWKELITYDNFIYLNPIEWSIEEVISISDVCINMSMNSPATIALICGKNALYFDDTGNIYHPFAKKYKNIIVFEDKDLLFKQIGNILNEEFNCRNIISEGEIREYDAFNDDNALERLRDNLCKIIL